MEALTIAGIVFGAVFAAVCVIEDIQGKIRLTHPVFAAAGLVIVPNAVAWVALAGALGWFAQWWQVALLSALGLLCAYFWIRLTFFPVMDGNQVGVRLKIMIGGRYIIFCAIWGFLLEAAFLPLSYRYFQQAGVSHMMVVNSGIAALALLALLLWNGILRLVFTSRHLTVFRRVLLLIVPWIPVVNLVVLLLTCRKVYEEYDFAIHKAGLRAGRVDSNLCGTKYPLLMAHGILFRDLKYFNYWGRIPGELTRLGAVIYYGNQEAVGTIAGNARDLRDRILEILVETGAEKVNIIAHSKGGLDSRYVISALGMDSCVASLTTINTPHRGCKFVDKAARLPEGGYRAISRFVDRTFRKLGDQNPDFYTATHQFTTSYLGEFNAKVPNSPRVYYQSYMSKMRGVFSDRLLWLPYCIIRKVEGPNDGLVGLTSAPWGNFRKLFQNSRGMRGISHGDMIDLKRQDYKGFDVVEAYVGIVADLKEKGF